MGHPAALAWAARLDDTVTPTSVAVGPGHRLALAWSLRGAPHVHRRKDLDALAAALFPLSEADAAGRLNETGPSVAKAGIAALEQYATAVSAMREVVGAPTAKGAASTAVSRRLPKAMLRQCRACKASHISDSAMRTASLTAGLEIEPGTAPPVLVPRPKARGPGRRRSEGAARARAGLSAVARAGHRRRFRRLPRGPPGRRRRGVAGRPRRGHRGRACGLPAGRTARRAAHGARPGRRAAARAVRSVPAGPRPQPDRPRQVPAQEAVAGARPAGRAARRRRGRGHVADEVGRARS